MKRTSRACVVQVDGAGSRWVKSSASGPDGKGQACVEILAKVDGEVVVRTSRDREGGRLRFRGPSWTMFLTDVKRI